MLELFYVILVIILIIAARWLLGFLGDVVNTCVIMTMVCWGVAINFIQTYRSQQAIERLRDQATPGDGEVATGGMSRQRLFLGISFGFRQVT